MKTAFGRCGAAPRALLLLLGLFSLMAQGAFAACTSPTGAAGDQAYNGTYNVMMFCNGTNWISMAGATSVGTSDPRIGTLTANKWCVANAGGTGLDCTTNAPTVTSAAGAGGDVEFNGGSGGLAVDTGNFTYSSGLLKAPNISTTAITASGAGNFGNLNSSGLGTLGSLIVTGGAAITGQASITTVSTSLLQIGTGAGAACTTGLAGGVRYNSTSNTIDYCSGSAWLSLGPSATVVPAFSVHKNGTNQTGLAAATYTKLTWSAKRFDTNNNFASDRFTPTIPGKYLITLAVRCTNTTTYCAPSIFKNGVGYTDTAAASPNTDYGAQTTAIIDMNGSTDYVEGYVYASGGAAYGIPSETRFDGILISMAGGGTGGSATPAGSTGDVQFNTAGALDADTGLFYWDKTNHRLGIGTNAPQAGIDVNNGLMVHGSANYATSDSGLEILKINSSLGTISMVNGPDRTERELRFYGTPMTFYTGGVERMRIVSVTGNVGIGTASPLAALHVSGTGGSSNSLVVEATSSGTNTSPRIGFIDTALGTASTAPVWYVDNAHDTFRIFRQPNYNTGGSLFFSVSNTGNVAIGSNNPIAKLDVNGTISSSNAIQVGTSTLTCSSGISGSLRYNTTSNTMDYCSGSAWLSLGPSGTTIPAFSVFRSTAQTGGVNIKIVMDTKTFDTYNNYSLATNKFTPTVAGKYLFTGFILCTAGNSQFIIYKNGSIYQYGGPLAPANDRSYITALIDMNGTTDYVEPYGYCSNGASSNFGAGAMNGFAGSLIASAASGSGNANTAGSTGDVQYNSGGAFAADTGQLYWDATNNRLGVGTTAPLTALYVSDSSTYVQGTFEGRNQLSGGIRLIANNAGNTASNIWEIQSVPSLATPSGSLIIYDRTHSRYAMTVDGATGNVGIGTTAPSATLHVTGAGTPYAMFGPSGTGAIEMRGDDSASGFFIRNDGANPVISTKVGSLFIGYAGHSGMALNFYTSNTFAGTWSPSGQLGIGTSSPNTALTVAGMISASTEVVAGLGSIGQFRAVAGNYGTILRNDGANFYLLETASGSPYGGWDATRPFTINLGTGNVSMANGQVTVTHSNGNVTAVAYLYSSDKRMKSDIASLTGGLAKLDALNPVSFLFTADPSKTIHLGLIAQDVQKVYPEAVHADEKGFLKLDYPALIGPIVDMLKELKALVLDDQAAIGRLKAANDNLEGDVKALKAENAALKAANDNFARRLDAVERRAGIQK